MKIFANNFALDLQIQDANHHFRFVRTPIREVAEQLARTTLMPHVLLYSDAEGEPLLNELVFTLHTRPDLGDRRITWNLLFETEEDRSGFYKSYRGLFKEVSAAGGLVLNPDEALLTILRNGAWDLPKGKVEKNESNEDAGTREVMEETGLNEVERLGLATTTFHIYLRKNRWEFKTTQWFWMKAESGMDLKPQTEEGITEIRWWPLEDLGQNIPKTFPQIMELMQKAIFEGPKLLQP